MRIRILKDIQMVYHTLHCKQEFNLPYKEYDKKTKRTLEIEFRTVDTTDVWKKGYYVSFSSYSRSAKYGYAGQSCPMDEATGMYIFVTEYTQPKLL